MKSLTKMKQSDTEQSDNNTDIDKRIIKDTADFQVSETVRAKAVSEVKVTDRHVQPENEERQRDIVQMVTIKIYIVIL